MALAFLDLARDALDQAAIGRGADAAKAATVTALIEPAVWQALRAAGRSTAAASRQIAGVLNAWLDTR